MKKLQAADILILLLIPVFSLSAYDQTWGARLDLNLDFPAMTGSSFGLLNLFQLITNSMDS